MKKDKNEKLEENGKKKENLPYDPKINSDDKQALHDKDLSMDQNQDKPLAERDNVDFTGEDLDIPGREDTDTSGEGTDLPDEENFQFDERGKRTGKDKKEKDEEIPDPDSFNP